MKLKDKCITLIETGRKHRNLTLVFKLDNIGIEFDFSLQDLGTYRSPNI